jgi:hypothetical protein
MEMLPIRGGQNINDLLIGLWSLVFGLWSLVFGLWSLVFGLGLVADGSGLNDQAAASVITSPPPHLITAPSPHPSCLRRISPKAQHP